MLHIAAEPTRAVEEDGVLKTLVDLGGLVVDEQVQRIRETAQSALGTLKDLRRDHAEYIHYKNNVEKIPGFLEWIHEPEQMELSTTALRMMHAIFLADPKHGTSYEELAAKLKTAPEVLKAAAIELLDEGYTQGGDKLYQVSMVQRTDGTPGLVISNSAATTSAQIEKDNADLSQIGRELGCIN